MRIFKATKQLMTVTNKNQYCAYSVTQTATQQPAVAAVGQSVGRRRN